MVENKNNDLAYNSFIEMSELPYKIIYSLCTDNSQEANDLFKLLKYTEVDCLSKPNLTIEEKLDMLWTGDSMETKYSIFMKPLLSSSLDTADSQTQMRLYRYNTMPTNRVQAIVCFEVDLITNEKSTMVRKDGILMERTDYMESVTLSLLNGRDVGVGNGFLSYDRELSRSCNSQLNISNSKNFYGRSLILGLNYANAEVGGLCD